MTVSSQRQPKELLAVRHRILLGIDLASRIWDDVHGPLVVVLSSWAFERLWVSVMLEGSAGTAYWNLRLVTRVSECEAARLECLGRVERIFCRQKLH